MPNPEVLSQAIMEYDGPAAAQWVKAALADKTSPAAVLDAVSGVMKEVGDQFSCGELWLPDLIGASEAAQEAVKVVEAHMEATGETAQTNGTVVVGTVFGDIHNIGKTMVSAFLTASGFRVIDLGINVPAEQFVAAVRSANPDLLAMSALLTTTMVEQRAVIQALTEAGIRDRVKIMVGGGAITPEFATEIGADGYGATAPAAASLARQLLGIQ